MTYPHPDVRAALEDWVVTRVDVGADRPAADLLGVAAVPALVALDPDGSVRARSVGYLTPEELTSWLASGSERAPTAGAPRATLRVATRVPGDELAERLELPFRVRLQGRELTRVEPGSAIDRLGLTPGDVLLALDGVDLYSEDDLQDVLRVHEPGDEVPIDFARATDGTAGTATVVLEEGPPGPAVPGIAWELASVAHLERAFELAAERDQGVLVGLSGAET